MDTLFPQPEPVFHDAAALDTTVAVLDPEPLLVECFVGKGLLQGQIPTVWLLRRHQELDLGEREGQEAQILYQPAPSRERVGVAFALRRSWVRPL